MRKKLLFVSEGPTDLGSLFRDESPENKRKGTLSVIVKKTIEHILGREIEDFEVKTKVVSRLNDWQKRRGKGKKSLKGFERQVLFTLQHIAYSDNYNDCDGVIFVVDQDNDSGRINRLREGKEEARKDPDLQQIKIAIGIAIVMLEAWLLADQNALGKGLKIQTPRMSSDPEKIKDPKTELRNLYEDSDDRNTAEKFLAIAEEIEIERLMKRCKKGFKPFYEEVREELAPIFR